MNFKKIPDAFDWSAGPPKTETDNWTWSRLGEVERLAAGFVAAHIQASNGMPGDDDLESAVDRAIKMARLLVNKSEALFPRSG